MADVYAGTGMERRRARHGEVAARGRVAGEAVLDRPGLGRRHGPAGPRHDLGRLQQQADPRHRAGRGRRLAPTSRVPADTFVYFQLLDADGA